MGENYNHHTAQIFEDVCAVSGVVRELAAKPLCSRTGFMFKPQSESRLRTTQEKKIRKKRVQKDFNAILFHGHFYTQEKILQRKTTRGRFRPLKSLRKIPPEASLPVLRLVGSSGAATIAATSAGAGAAVRGAPGTLRYLIPPSPSLEKRGMGRRAGDGI